MGNNCTGTHVCFRPALVLSCHVYRTELEFSKCDRADNYVVENVWGKSLNEKVLQRHTDWERRCAQSHLRSGCNDELTCREPTRGHDITPLNVCQCCVIPPLCLCYFSPLATNVIKWSFWLSMCTDWFSVYLTIIYLFVCLFNYCLW